MHTDTIGRIQHAFPSTKWIEPKSKKYQSSIAALDKYTDEDITEAITVLKRIVVRTTITVDEIETEIRRIKKSLSLHRMANKQGINTTEAVQGQDAMRAALIASDRAVIAAAVAKCRRAGVLSATPLPPDIREWTMYAVGMVGSALADSL